jgi:hypothetical protein
MGFIKIEQKRKQREGEKESLWGNRLAFGSFTYNITLQSRNRSARSSSQLAANNRGGLASNHVSIALFSNRSRRDAAIRSCEASAEWHSHSQSRGVDASSSLRLCVLLLPWLRPEGDHVKSRTRFDCRSAVFSSCLMINWNYTLKRLGSQFYPATTRYLASETSHEAANS